MRYLMDEHEHLKAVVDWFSRQQASRIPELETPLRCYLSRLPAAERKRVVPTQTRKKSTLKSTQGTLKRFEHEALEYLRAKQDERRGVQVEDSRILLIVNALAFVCDSNLTEKEFWGLLANASENHIASITADDAITAGDAITADDGSQRCSTSTQTSIEGVHPLQRLLCLYRKVELSKYFYNLAARILKVLIHYQYKSSGASGIDSDARRRYLLQRTGFTVEGTKDLRSRATGWLRMMSVFGVGALAMVQAQADDEFEKNAPVLFLQDCHQFFVEKYPTVLERINDINKIVSSLFVQLNMKYARDGSSLSTGPEVLSKCLRRAFAQSRIVRPHDDSAHDTGTEQTAMSSPTAIATAAAATGDRDFTSPDPQGHPQDGQIETPSMYCSRPNDTNGAPVAQPGDRNMQMQVSERSEVAMVPNLLHEQATQSQWHTYAEQTSPQQETARRDALYGTQSIPHYANGRAHMATSEQNTTCGLWPAAGAQGSHDIMSPQFLLDNTLGTMYHSTIGNGYNINEEWEKTVGELYARF